MLALVFTHFSGQAVAKACSAVTRWRARLVKVGFLSSRQHFRMQPPLSREGTVQRALALSHQTVIDCWMQQRCCCICRCLKQGKAVRKVCDGAYQSGKLAMRSTELPPELWDSIVSRHRSKEFQEVSRHCSTAASRLKPLLRIGRRKT